MAVGGTAAIVLPEKWVKPFVDIVIVPAHAAGSVIPAPDPMPTGPALPNVSVFDNAGGSPIYPSINAGGATDPLGRGITYSMSSIRTSSTLGWDPGTVVGPLTLTINSATGVISGAFEANGTETFTVTVTATPAGGTHPLVRTFTLTIVDQG